MAPTRKGGAPLSKQYGLKSVSESSVPGRVARTCQNPAAKRLHSDDVRVETSASAVPPEPALSERSESKGRSPGGARDHRSGPGGAGRSVPSEPIAAPIYLCADSAPIFSITIAVDPPRAYTFPLAVTLCPAKGSNFSF